MKLFYQVVGKLEGYETIDYRFESEILRDFRLSSDAMHAYYRDEALITYIFPMSLASRSPDLFTESGRLENLEEHFVNRFAPQVKHNDFRTLIIQSIGDFDGIDFRGDYDDVVLRIFGRMVEDYLNLRPDEIYVDISTGLNLYVSALLEAFRYFLIWVRLLEFGSSDIPHFYRLFAEPFLGDRSKEIYDIYRKRMRAKAFFLSPINAVNLERFSPIADVRLLRRFLVVFSSIYRNAPLYLFHHGIDDSEIIRNAIYDLLRRISDETGAYRSGEGYVEFDGKGRRRLYTDLLLSYALYHRISSVVYDLVDGEIFEDYKDMGVHVDYLMKTFEKIYNLFGLEMNMYLLENEVNKLKDRILHDRRTRAKFEFRFSPVKFALEYYSDRDDGKINGRNFLAHAGFESSITIARVWKNALYLKYDEDVEDEIEHVLLEIDPTF